MNIASLGVTRWSEVTLPIAKWRAAFLIVALLTAGAANPNAFAWQTPDETPVPPATMANSTKKIRVQPSKVAGRIGSSVAWRESLETAIAESQQTGKPIFWYVHTVPGTFTDRKIEIDRYLMAGMFSWPKIIQLLNTETIPLRVAPDVAAAARLELQPYRFVEPGFVVFTVGPTDEVRVRQRVDQLTTLHPDWLLNLVRRSLAAPNTGDPANGGDPPNAGGPASPVESIWSLHADSEAARRFRQFMAQPSRQFEHWGVFDADAGDSSQRMEPLLMKGMVQYYTGDHEGARQTWGQAVICDPEHPLAWKAAAEREGFGPFVRGFEVHVPLPATALNAGIESAGSASPAGVYSQAEQWRRSTQFLLAMQRGDGAWVDSDYDFGGTDSLPNVYTAVTALAGLALMEASHRLPDRADDIRAAIEKAADFVRDESHINPADRDEILWAYAYRLRFLVARHRLGLENLETINAAAQRLESVQGNRGSWYHEYSNSFVTATALVALAEAQSAGAAVNPTVVERGLAALQRDRFANGAFPYSNARGSRSNPEAEGDLVAAAGRMPICELALYLWDKSDQSRLQFAVENSLKHHDKLQVAYKYDNHTSTLAYGGFFFWYDMQSRAEAIGYLKDVEARDAAANQHRSLIAKLPELDGCFVDSHELGRCYGSAMALLSLSVLESDSAQRSQE